MVLERCPVKHEHVAIRGFDAMVDAIALKTFSLGNDLIQSALEGDLKFCLFAGLDAKVDEFENHCGFQYIFKTAILALALALSWQRKNIWSDKLTQFVAGGSYIAPICRRAASPVNSASVRLQPARGMIGSHRQTRQSRGDGASWFA